mmetsp:Transcript_951/g.2906  ORF Transcript_951/g.2906 Transcript_951/m.2906 type:complete len:209 (+) Transcript_951:59-685(+)
MMTFPKPPSDLLQPAPLNIRTCFRTGNSAPVARRSRLQLFPAHAEATDAINRDRVWPIPRDAEETAQEARAAVQRAWADGIKRQRVELLLPLIGATDLDDWPGGVRQQFKAVLPMVESMLTGLKAVDGLQGALNGEIWDQGDGAPDPLADLAGHTPAPLRVYCCPADSLFVRSYLNACKVGLVASFLHIETIFPSPPRRCWSRSSLQV